MTFFSAPDDASAARGPLNAVTDFWARALDPKMFGLSGQETAEAFWAWPMMASKAMSEAMTEGMSLWSGSFGALCVPAKADAAAAPAPEVAPAVQVEPEAARPVAVAVAKPVAVPAAPVLELPPVILAEVAPIRAATATVAAGKAEPAIAAKDTPAAADKPVPISAVVPEAPLRAATAEETAALAATVAAIEPEDFKRPARIEKPKRPDDLKLISGVGPKIEKTLHGLGVYTFAQIAGWTPAEIAWVDDYVSFQGRIVRDDWLAQAAALAKGGRDEYRRIFGKEPR